MTVYTSYAATTAPHFGDLRVLAQAGPEAWNPNFATLKNLMPGGTGTGSGVNYNFNDALPAVPPGHANVKWQADSPSTSPRHISAYVPDMTGDSGSGGIGGGVPAPAAGTAAAGKYLKADGTWSVPAGGGGGLPSTAPANEMLAGPASGAAAAPAFRTLVLNDYPFHAEPLTDGFGNFIFAAGDVIAVVGVPN